MRSLILACLVFASSVCADPAARVAAAFDGWLARVGAPDAVIVLMQGDRVLLALDRGLAPDAPVELQSTSKMITALCAASLVGDGVLGWDRPVSDWLQTGSAITPGQLVTHTSGLTRDQTQGRMVRWRGDTVPRWPDAATRALGRTPRGAPGKYAYNNENYAILGAVIEAAAGVPYATECARRVLAPAGVTSAGLSPLTGSFGPWGGWRMSPLDYARLHRHHFAGFDPTAYPRADLGGGAFYGLGMLHRAARGGGFNHWHFGLLCFPGRRGDGGSFTVSWGRDYSLFAAWSACTDWDRTAGLDRALTEALFSKD